MPSHIGQSAGRRGNAVTGFYEIEAIHRRDDKDVRPVCLIYEPLAAGQRAILRLSSKFGRIVSRSLVNGERPGCFATCKFR